MVELALLEEATFFASPLELADRVTYTIETLESFRRQQPEASLVLLLGSDSFGQLDRWRDWRKILQIAEVAVLERPTDEPAKPSADLHQALGQAHIHRIANLPVDISSTEIRRGLATRCEDVQQFLPPLVVDYIEKYDLYR